MKKINLAKKALLPALIAVICSVVALTSVSYAWFTIGEEASISDINVNVIEAEGIQISPDAAPGNWKSFWEGADFISDYDEDLKFYPVSTNGDVSNGELNMYTGSETDEGVVFGELEEDENYFYCFPIYVQLDAAKTLQLSAESTVTSESIYSNCAARIAFINLGTISFEEWTDKTAFDELDHEHEIKIWEPNSLKTVAKDTGILTDRREKADYSGVYKKENGQFAHDITTTTFDFAKDENEKYVAEDLFDLEEGYTKILVYIWLEGQDEDCHNRVAGSSFSSLIKFQITETEEVE